MWNVTSIDMVIVPKAVSKGALQVLVLKICALLIVMVLEVVLVHKLGQLTFVIVAVTSYNCWVYETSF